MLSNEMHVEVVSYFVIRSLFMAHFSVTLRSILLRFSPESLNFHSSIQNVQKSRKKMFIKNIRPPGQAAVQIVKPLHVFPKTMQWIGIKFGTGYGILIIEMEKKNKLLNNAIVYRLPVCLTEAGIWNVATSWNFLMFITEARCHRGKTWNLKRLGI